MLVPCRKILAPCTHVGVVGCADAGGGVCIGAPPNGLPAWVGVENPDGVVSAVEFCVDKGATVYAPATFLDTAAICVE